MTGRGDLIRRMRDELCDPDLPVPGAQFARDGLVVSPQDWARQLTERVYPQERRALRQRIHAGCYPSVNVEGIHLYLDEERNLIYTVNDGYHCVCEVPATRVRRALLTELAWSYHGDLNLIPELQETTP